MYITNFLASQCDAAAEKARLLRNARSVGPFGHFLAQRCPFQQSVERRAESLTPVRETVLHLRRHLMVDDPSDHAVVFHLSKLLDQHLLGNRRNSPLQLREAQDLPAEEVEQDR